ncbi:unnamed protein product [Rotaria sp. Silwood1]|nr:unnamed protein product [Rotaria sp. Silwood1]
MDVRADRRSGPAVAAAVAAAGQERPADQGAARRLQGACGHALGLCARPSRRAQGPPPTGELPAGDLPGQGLRPVRPAGLARERVDGKADEAEGRLPRRAACVQLRLPPDHGRQPAAARAGADEPVLPADAAVDGALHRVRRRVARRHRGLAGGRARRRHRVGRPVALRQRRGVRPGHPEEARELRLRGPGRHSERLDPSGNDQAFAPDRPGDRAQGAPLRRAPRGGSLVRQHRPRLRPWPLAHQAPCPPGLWPGHLRARRQGRHEPGRQRHPVRGPVRAARAHRVRAWAGLRGRRRPLGRHRRGHLPDADKRQAAGVHPALVAAAHHFFR